MKYTLPDFLKDVISEQTYRKWLQRKAAIHYRRDRKKGRKDISTAKYKQLIHQAAIDSNGRDQYTGERLDWYLLSKFKNKKLPMLPTVDHCHMEDGGGFKICSWMVNDLKNDLSLRELRVLMKKIEKYLAKR